MSVLMWGGGGGLGGGGVFVRGVTTVAVVRNSGRHDVVIILHWSVVREKHLDYK